MGPLDPPAAKHSPFDHTTSCTGTRFSLIFGTSAGVVIESSIRSPPMSRQHTHPHATARTPATLTTRNLRNFFHSARIQWKNRDRNSANAVSILRRAETQECNPRLNGNNEGEAGSRNLRATQLAGTLPAHPCKTWCLRALVVFAFAP